MKVIISVSRMIRLFEIESVANQIYLWTVAVRFRTVCLTGCGPLLCAADSMRHDSGVDNETQNKESEKRFIYCAFENDHSEWLLLVEMALRILWQCSSICLIPLTFRGKCPVRKLATKAPDHRMIFSSLTLQCQFKIRGNKRTIQPKA